MDAAGGEGGCMAADSGLIQRDQIVLMAGLHATFRVAENVDVNTAGQMNPDGTRTWDLSVSQPGDHDVLVDTLSPKGAWYAGAFPSATYATQLSDTSNLLGVFQTTSGDVLLQGVVSPSSGVTQTKLTYKPAVVTLQFPVQAGATWSTNATVSGTADGVPGVYFEDYKTKVDYRGTLKTPLATFPVLRVGTVLTRTAGATVTVIRSFVFVTDCYGPVASITSQPDAAEAEFTSAAELRRIAP